MPELFATRSLFPEENRHKKAPQIASGVQKPRIRKPVEFDDFIAAVTDIDNLWLPAALLPPGPATAQCI